MDYLTLQNRRNEGESIPDDRFISAKDKHVIIIGGGDTGADCLGTAHRQGAASVHQLELLAQPPDTRSPGNPWPLWPNIFRVSSRARRRRRADVFDRDAEVLRQTIRAGSRRCTRGRVEMVNSGGRIEFKPVPNSEFELKADLVLLAMGFLGPETNGMLTKLGVKMTDRGNVWRDERWMTSVPGVFAAGDMQRGQSLIVWAIAEGRSCARGVDEYLMGRTSLPAPLS